MQESGDTVEVYSSHFITKIKRDGVASVDSWYRKVNVLYTLVQACNVYNIHIHIHVYTCTCIIMYIHAQHVHVG